MKAWHGIDRQQAEQTVASLEEKLRSCEKMLSIQEGLLKDDPESMIYRLSWDSISVTRDEVQAQLADVLYHRAAEPFDFAISGDDFSFNSTNVRGLSTVLVHLQNLYTSIYQSVSVGATTTGRFCTDIVNASTLHLAGVFPSSFGMNLYVESQPDLMAQSNAIEAFRTMFGLLEQFDQSDEMLMDSAASLGPRAFNHLYNLTHALISNNANIKMKWHAPNGSLTDWATEGDKLHVINSKMSTLKTEHTQVKQAQGTIVGASLIKRNFELLTREEELISGRIPMKLLEQVKEHFAKSCTISYTERRITDQVNGRTRTSRTLESLSSLTQ